MAMNDKTFSEALTFTRASTKWVFDGTGTLVEVPVDQPAYDHDPLTGEPLGLLVEESRTNLLLWSEAFDDAAWVNNISSITADATSAPDGNTTAAKLVEGTGDGVHSTHQDILSSTEGQDYVGAVFVKAAERTRCRVTLAGLAISNANVSLDLTLTDSTPNSEYMGDGWHRIFVTAAASGGGSVRAIVAIEDDSKSAGYTGDGTSGIYIWGAQLEAASNPSSYIPTTDAPATRAADNVSRVLGEEFNPSEGTFYGEFSSWEPGVQSAVFTLGNFDNNIRVFKASSGRVDATIVKDGVTYDTITDAPNDNYLRWAFVYRADGTYALSLGGLIHEALDNLPDSPPDLSGETLRVGRNPFVGAIRNATGATYSSFRYIPRALTEQELIDLTS